MQGGSSKADPPEQSQNAKPTSPDPTYNTPLSLLNNYQNQ